MRKVINYCPGCHDVPEIKKNNGDLAIIVSKECVKHQPKFVKTGTGIMVKEALLEKFKEMMRPATLSSQEI